MSRANPRFRRANAPLPAAVPNLFEVTLNTLIEGQNCINTLYYADGGAALVAATESNIATGWNTAFGTNYKAVMSADATFVSIKVQCLTTPTRIPFILTVGAAGTGPAGHEPTTVGVTVFRKSGIKGQAGRGRITLPALPTSWVTASQVNSTGQTALNANYANIVGTNFVAATITYTPQVVSRKNKAGPLLGASPVLTGSYSLTVGSCRRRKLGRGK